MGKQRITELLEKGMQAEEATPISKLQPLSTYNPYGTEQFKSTQGSEDFSRSVKNNKAIKDFSPYVQSGLNLEANNIEELRTEGQTGVEQTLNALTQFGGQLLGGAAMSLGTTLDIEQSIKTVLGTEKEYKNLLFDFGKSLIESTAKSAPIYEKEPGEVNPSDSGWWATMFANTGLSAGIMVESMVETAALSALTGGAGMSTSVAGAAKKGKMLQSIKSLMGSGDAAAKLRRSATMFGVINRHHEGIMEAADSFETEYKDLLKKGKTETEARDGAAKSAQATYLGNLPLMALDIMQFRAMTFNPISGGSKGGIVENVLGSIKNKTLAKGIGQTFGVASEGVEEYWQALVQSEAKNYADNASGVGTGSTFKERFSDFNSKGSTWNAAISGVFGGALLGGAAKGFQKLTESNATKQLDKDYKSFVNNISGIGTEMVNEIRTLDEAGESVKANNLRRSMGVQKALHAIHLDNLKDSDAAFTSYTSYMGGLLDAINNGDAEQIKNLGIEGSEDFLKENIPNYLEDATKIQNIYEQVKQNNHRDAVIPITYRRFLQDNLSAESSKLAANIASVEASIPDMANISNPGRAINEASVNIKMAEARIKSLNKELTNDKLGDIEKEGIRNDLLHLNLGVTANQRIIEDQKEIAKTVSEAQRLYDQEVLQSVNLNANLQQLKANKLDVDGQLARVRKELNLWSDTDFQAKGAVEKTYAIVNESQTVQELDTTEKTLVKQGLFTDDIRARLNKKRKELVAKEEAEALLNNNPLPVNTPEQKANQAPVPTPMEQLIAREMGIQTPAEVENPAETPFIHMGEAPKSPERQVAAVSLFDFGIMDSSVEDTSVVGNTEPVETPVISVPAPTTLSNSEVSAQATIIDMDDLFEPANLSDDISDEQKEGIRKRLAEYYTSLSAELGKTPSFKELVEDMINNTSAQEVDTNFNLLKLGWELNSYAKTDFDKVYNELFGTRKSKARDFFNFGQQSLVTEQEYKAEQEQINEQEAIELAPAVQVTEVAPGEKVFVSTAKFQTVESTLKFAHLSQTYDETRTEEGLVTTIDRQTNTDELNQSDYVDSRELMNPNLYSTGTELDVKIPENSGKILLTQWDENFQKGAPITFEAWAESKDPNSDEYIGRMPMIIYNGDKGVAFVHDVDWYNPTNLGFEETPAKQKELIAAAKKELLDFRKTILANNGSLKIKVTEKRPGTKIVIPATKPNITVAQANPDAILGTVNDLGNINIGGEIINASQLMNAKSLDKGHKYDLRQSGLNPDGTKQYLATKVKYEVLSSDVQKSIAQAVRVYMARSDQNGSMGNPALIEQMRQKVLKESGLDLFSQEGLESYLNMFMETYSGKAKKNIDIANEINANPAIVNGTPWFAISSGRIVMGIKGSKLSNSEKDGFTSYMHPDNFLNPTTEGISRDLGTLKKLMAPNFLGAVKQNLSLTHLESNTPVSLIGTEGLMNYKDFLKTKFTTNLRSVRLEDGTYASFTQPVIQFTYENKPASVTPQGAEITVVPTVETTPASLIQSVATQLTGQAPAVDESALIQSIAEAMEGFEKLGLTPEAMQSLRDLTDGTAIENLQYDPEYERLTDDIIRSIQRKLTKISDLEIIDRNTVVQFIANQVMTEINPQARNTISRKDLIKKVNSSFNDIVAPKVNLVNQKIEALRALQATGKYEALNLGNVIDQMGNLKANAEILRANWSELVNEAFTDYIEKFTGISVKLGKDDISVSIAEEDRSEVTEREDEQEFDITMGDQREKDYSKESVEDNGKNSASYLTKRFLAQIPSYDQGGKPKMGYLGLTAYPGFDYYHDAIGSMLASPNTVGASLNDVLIRLESHADGKPWVAEVIKRLKESDGQMQNAFMYDLVRHSLSMKFVMHSYNSKTGNTELKVYDTNANEILRVIQAQWREGFKQSPLSSIDGENYKINAVKAQELLNEFNSWNKVAPAPVVAQKWLANFGITLSAEAMAELSNNGYYVTENKKSVQFPYAKMFDKSGRTNGIFGLMATYLDRMVHPGTNLDYQENESVNPFDDSSGILSKLATIQSKYSLNVTTNSYRDGDKSIFGYTPNKFATSFLDELITNPDVIEAKKKISFDQNSFWMDLLLGDDIFKQKFHVDHLGNNAFKQLGKPLYRDSNIGSLADADHEMTKLGMFQDTKQGEVKTKTFNGLPLRVGRMFFPTMSDKSTMLDITTAVLNLRSQHFTFNEDGSVVINQAVKDFMFSQMIEPELKRIIAHHDKAKELEVHPNELVNQKGYNMGAQIFNMIPAMNIIQFKGQNGDIRLIEYLADSAGMVGTNTDTYGALVENIKEQTSTLLDTMFNQMADQKVSAWEENGFITRVDPNGPINLISNMSATYMGSIQGSLDQKAKVAALDYVINSAISNANIHMVFSGDVANYSQDKAFKNNVAKEGGKLIPYKPVNDGVYANMSEGVVSVNLGKRLALLIAPGQTIAQSKDDKYVQLFLQDRVSMSENIEFLIELYHGKNALTEVVKEKLQTAKNTTTKEGMDALKMLMDAFPSIDAYFAIESTDAQEYTTSKEHLDILFRQGRVSVEQYEDFTSKVAEQKKAEEQGRAIPESALLSDADLKIIFQPIKPVYTGQQNDVDNNVSRMVYIKSSSFPLLPQMTSAFPGLDGLRKKMEEIETKSHKNVRASYDTANKVGAVLSKHQLQVWDENGSFVEDSINVDDIIQKLESGDDTSALVLDRKFFRIQQDVPFKSTKKTKQDTITVGTQMMKLIFGDGVGKITEPIFNGRSGVQLQGHYNNMFNKWISAEKTNLYESLGIDESTGRPIDKLRTIKKLQALLQDEAKKRGYPKQDIEALELDSNGDLSENIQFTMPLWLSPNSNRYEAMLNAMVTSRLLNLKLPGASFVAGSEEGFRFSENISAVDTSKAVFTSKWTGELKAAGKNNLAQALMPSKFRGRDGRLLDLLQKDEHGQYVYVTQENNGAYRLKEDMVDMSLLSNPTFRIPTSSHVSMAQVEIVGFLPVETGDLIIVPKNFTKQKGLDFDVDKENVYMLHHVIDENGKVISASDQGFDAEGIAEDIKYLEENIQIMKEASAEIRAQIEEFQDEIEVNTEIGIDNGDAKNFIKELKKDPTLKDYKEAVKHLKFVKDLQVKLYQNEIINAYSSVLGSTDSRIQEKINKVLSTDFAEGQANIIDGMIRQSTDNTHFSILSDEFQKYKMSLGAAGKLGIGVYSNYVVLHSLIQQSKQPITLMTEQYDAEGKKTMVPFELEFGGQKFDGNLGGIGTLDGSRSITDVNAERQNTATDNEKLQIMGKTNVNELTINVDAVLSLMGFDKDTAVVNGNKIDVSVSYALLSQPIIRNYVEAIRKTKSALADYDAEAEVKVIVDLRKKYASSPTPGIASSQNPVKDLTGQKLIDNILDNGADGRSQQAALDLFLQLKAYGEQITGLQSKLNVQSSGLGKSAFEMMEKYANVGRLRSNQSIRGIDSLVGRFEDGEQFTGENSDQRQELIDQGYVIFDNPEDPLASFALQPRTVVGSLIAHSAKAGYELWADYFPNQNTAIKGVFDEVLGLISDEDVSETKKIKLQHEIMGEMKKYLYSSGKIGIFSGNPQQERNRLFFDKGDNQSVASYLFHLLRSDHPAKDLIANNKLLGRFTYTLENGSVPSLIKYDNSKSEDFNEEYKYLALVELMDKNMLLPDLNGKPYTSRMLAKDLITYSYISGGVQGAVEFVKYIPVAYLKELGFADKTQGWQQAAIGKGIPGLWQNMLGQSFTPGVISRFAMQFLQHNPQKLPKETEANMEKQIYADGTSKDLANLYAFNLKQNPENIKPFISVYNKDIPKGRSKFQIYQYDSGKYRRVSTLGIFGMAEYSMRVSDVVPLIDKHFPLLNAPVKPPVGNQTPSSAHVAQFGVDKDNLQGTLDQIIEADIKGISPLLKALSPYIDNSTKLTVGPIARGNAVYSTKNNNITLNTAYVFNSTTTPEMVARTVAHEYVHSLTSRVIREYFDQDGNALTENIPFSMLRLQRLFRETQKVLGPGLEEFSQWYTNPDNKGKVRNNPTDRMMYAGLDIHEFTAMIMTEPALQEAMAKVPYMKTGHSLLQQFVESIKKILTELGVVFKEGSLTTEAMNTVFSIITEDSKPPTNNTSNGLVNFEPSSVDVELERLLNEEDYNEMEDESHLLEPVALQEDDLDIDCIF